MFARLMPQFSIPAASGGYGLALSGLFGFLFALIVTPPGFLDGSASYWQTQVEDIAQYQSGFTAYIRSPWALPLLSIPSLNWPSGTVVTFVDAIPALAVPWKILAAFLPMPENPFGYWLAFCFVMQGIGAWYVSRQIIPNRWLALGLVVVFSVWMPSLTGRMGHLSLQGHFLLLFSLGLYFKTRLTQEAQIASWATLLLVAFYVNFYLTAMATAIMIACSLDLYWQTKKRMILLLHTVPLLAVALSVPLFLGTAFGTAVPDPGFGYYSMNLLSPVAHGNLLEMPFYQQGKGQYEGYNYLGLGLILAAVLSLLLKRKKTTPTLSLSGPNLIFVMVLFFAYSLSNDVYMSSIHLIHWDVPGFFEPLLETFRSSGRFFWPISYLLVFVIVSRLTIMSDGRLALVATALLALQAADIYPTFVAVKASLLRPANEPANLSDWNRALAGVQTIHAFPKFKCDGALIREVMPLQVVAAKGGYNLTTGFISRYGADCDAIESEIASSDPDTAAYVFTRAQFTDDEINRYKPEGTQCTQLDIWIVCRKDPS